MAVTSYALSEPRAGGNFQLALNRLLKPGGCGGFIP
jgi:hypothetical protein